MRKADDLPPSCAVVTKSGNLNIVEPSGPVMGFLYLFTELYPSLLLTCRQNTFPSSICFDFSITISIATAVLIFCAFLIR